MEPGENTRYKRLLREAEPPLGLLNTACDVFAWIEGAVRQLRIWVQSSRKLEGPKQRRKPA